MATGKYSRDARCPFYKTDRERQIKCEGYREDMTSTHLNFMHPDHLKKYMRIYCCDQYEDCPLYQLIIQEKYQ